MKILYRRWRRREAGLRISTRLRGRVVPLLLLVPRFLFAQNSGLSSTADAEHATRRQLEGVVARAESLATNPNLSTAERRRLDSAAHVAKHRLQFGDFGVGDLIVLSVQDQPSLSDTFTVTAGRHLQLPSMGDLDLTGVLRSELTERVTAHIAEYVRYPVVRATPLIRLSIVGAVAHPGYYELAADLPVSDWIMRAGGPTPTADLDKLELRRGGEKARLSAQPGTPIPAGAMVDPLSLRSGDEIVVGERTQIGATTVFQFLTPIAGLLVAFLAMQSTRHR